jgi:ubiquinone/menaquinone biosynthesis C-methylase UbiE
MTLSASTSTSTSGKTPDFSAIKGRQQQTWASGDYHMIAAIIVPVAERLCDTVDLRAGQTVLDVATGSGNAAIAAARRLCKVTGSDYVQALLDRGQVRASAEGVPVTFELGDAEALPYQDNTYDVVMSTFGVMFAPNQALAAHELVRVCRPGGRIGLANWTPDGWVGDMFRTVGRYVPPPAGIQPATRWGTEAGVRELLGDGISSLQTSRQKFVWRFSSAEQYLDLFRRYYGPVLKAFDALDEPGQSAMASELLAGVERFAIPSQGTLLVPAEYLEVVATTA